MWFTFWIDATGRVRQLAMDAPEHFMVDTYTSYNKPVGIAPPPG
jgi:DNA-directed RNA polymerase subunit K/omega